MAQKCDYAVTNEFGRLICTVDESRLCAFQRYCSKASEWQNSKAYSTCERRRNVSKNRNNNIELESEAIVMAMAINEEVNEGNKVEEIKEENSVIEEPKQIQKTEKKAEEKKNKKNDSRKFKKKKAEVVRVSLASMTVKDKNGNFYRIMGKPTAQVGDIIEF